MEERSSWSKEVSGNENERERCLRERERIFASEGKNE